MVAGSEGIIANIQLEQGDQIVIPNKTDLIQVGGEVLMPQAVVYNPNANLDDYVVPGRVGLANVRTIRRIAIVHANGLVEFKGQGNVSQETKSWCCPRSTARPLQSVRTCPDHLPDRRGGKRSHQLSAPRNMRARQ